MAPDLPLQKCSCARPCAPPTFIMHLRCSTRHFASQLPLPIVCYRQSLFRVTYMHATPHAADPHDCGRLIIHPCPAPASATLARTCLTHMAFSLRPVDSRTTSKLGNTTHGNCTLMHLWSHTPAVYYFHGSLSYGITLPQLPTTTFRAPSAALVVASPYCE